MQVLFLRGGKENIGKRCFAENRTSKRRERLHCSAYALNNGIGVGAWQGALCCFALGDLSTSLEMTFFGDRHFDQVKRVEKSPNLR